MNLVILQLIMAQNCINDSIVVREYFENRHNNQGLLVQTIIETSVFNRDSGTVGIYTRSSVMGGDYTPLSFEENVWVHTDTIRNASSEIEQIYSKIGSITGWKNYKTENYLYNNDHFILSKTRLDWNGVAWDSVSYNTWNYDVQNRLIESAVYLFSAGVRINKDLFEIVYLNGSPYSKTFSTGFSVNQWKYTKRFIFTYTGNLRTNVEVNIYDINSSSWLMYGNYSYNNNFGEYSFVLPEYTPVVINGISSADTLLTGYDTLEEKTYIRNIHFTGIDTMNVYFGVEGEVFYNIYNRYDNQLLITQAWYSDWATMNLIDSTWSSIDRPYVNQYFYDNLGRCKEIATSGGCSNPCGGYRVYMYDSLGRLYKTTYEWETMVTDHFISNTYHFSDTASISLLIAPNDKNVSGCFGSTFQPSISAIGGCLPYTVQWYPNIGLSSDSIFQPDILIDSAITYTIVVHDNSGHIDSSTITLSPAALPQNNILIDSVYCNGNTDLYLPWYSEFFHWYLDSLLIPGAISERFTATSPGEYHATGLIKIGDIYTHSFYCPIQSDTVTIHPLVLPVLSNSNDTIFINYFGAQYDWFRDSVLINSTTDSFLIINQNGNYHVTVTLQSGCSYTSNTLNVLNTGIVKPEKIFYISPNPVNDRLWIYGSNELEIMITDIAGKNIFHPLLNPDHSLDVSFLSKGSYFLLINSESGYIRFLFLKI